MNRQNKLLTGTSLAILCATILGCANYVWLKNGQPAGQAEFDRDSMYCTERSVAAFPPVTTTVVLENRKYVDKGNVCAYNPKTFRNECGDTIEVIPEKTQQRDANENARNNHKWTCMGSLGWAQHQVKKEIPQEEKPTVSDRFKGVGGSCKYPADCAGSLTCKDGVCSEPSPYAPPLAIPKSGVGGSCQQASNCSGDSFCYRGKCQTRGNECRDNSYCKQGLLCYGGLCLAPQ